MWTVAVVIAIKGSITEFISFIELAFQVADLIRTIDKFELEGTQMGLSLARTRELALLGFSN